MGDSIRKGERAEIFLWLIGHVLNQYRSLSFKAQTRILQEPFGERRKFQSNGEAKREKVQENHESSVVMRSRMGEVQDLEEWAGYRFISVMCENKSFVDK